MGAPICATELVEALSPLGGRSTMGHGAMWWIWSAKPPIGKAGDGWRKVPTAGGKYGYPEYSMTVGRLPAYDPRGQQELIELAPPTAAGAMYVGYDFTEILEYRNR